MNLMDIFPNDVLERIRTHGDAAQMFLSEGKISKAITAHETAARELTLLLRAAEKAIGEMK